MPPAPALPTVAIVAVSLFAPVSSVSVSPTVRPALETTLMLVSPTRDATASEVGSVVGAGGTTQVNPQVAGVAGSVGVAQDQDVVELVAGSCSRTPPRRSVWITRPLPSGRTSKPIGSLRFGGAATNDCW